MRRDMAGRVRVSAKRAIFAEDCELLVWAENYHTINVSTQIPISRLELAESILYTAVGLTPPWIDLFGPYPHMFNIYGWNSLKSIWQELP